MMEVFQPHTLMDLLALLGDHPDAALLAGGTDLLPRMRSGVAAPRKIIFLDGIGVLAGVTEEADAIRIGARTTLSRLIEDAVIRERLPALAAAVRVLGSPPIRNMATIGGNIVTASPAGDTLPPLYALGAEVELLSPRGARRVPVREFITGPGATLLEPGEVLAEVRIPKPCKWNVQHFEKVGNRNALAIAVASLAALLKISGDGVVEKASLAWGSVAPTVLACPEAEAALVGKPLGRESLERAADAARRAARPITDLRAAAETRRILTGNLLLRLLNRTLWVGVGG